MQAENDDDIDGGQRSNVVNYGYHIWSKEALM